MQESLRTEVECYTCQKNLRDLDVLLHSLYHIKGKGLKKYHTAFNDNPAMSRTNSLKLGIYSTHQIQGIRLV